MIRIAIFALALVAAALCGTASTFASGSSPERVAFAGPDGQQLVGYLFRRGVTGPRPTVVMMHGRAGPFSSLADGVYDASTLSKRHVLGRNLGEPGLHGAPCR